MLNVLKRIFIGVTVGLLIFLIKDNVFAATVPVSSQQFMYTRHTCLIGEVGCTDFWTSGYSSAGTWLDPPTQPSGVDLHRYYLVGVYVRTNATLTTGNTYSFTFRTQFNPKTDNVLKHINALQYNVYVNVSNNWTDTQVASQVCSTRNVVTHDYAIETTCTFTINSNASGVLVRSIYSFTQTPEHITTSNFHIESAQNEIGILTEINTTIKSITSQIITSIQASNTELLDADADATHTYNNDYSTSDYDQAESSMNQNLDVDVSDFTFDPTQWAHSFSYIWSLVTAFVTINNRVFATITGFLTLSFVGLVIGRS